MSIGGSSPHTRGALRALTVLLNPSRIIPAYAGSTRVWRIECLRWRDHPRIRGEHLSMFLMMVYAVGSSPHTRGAPRLTAWMGRRWRIIPAYAGSTALASQAHSIALDHPRIRGEHASPASIPATARDHPRIRGEHRRPRRLRRNIPGSSPHTRGAPPSRSPPAAMARIIPAYAGSTKSAAGWLRRRPDHPRIRGEHPSG